MVQEAGSNTDQKYIAAGAANHESRSNDCSSPRVTTKEMMYSIIRALRLSLLGVLISLPVSAQGLKGVARTHLPKLQKVLSENIQDFWLKNGLDREYGGYVISFDNDGRIITPYSKMIVTQARQVWLHSRLARAGYKREENLKAAAHGYKFLRERMWDARNGGFYWEVDAQGTPQKTHKHLYGQSFGLYAISEYALVTRDNDALTWAREIFKLLEEKAHDARYKGYNEFFTADWQPVPAGTANYIARASTPVKLYNTHLHLLESITTFYRASKLPLARERLLELIEIETDEGRAQGVSAVHRCACA